MPETDSPQFSLTFQLSVQDIYKSNLAIAAGNRGWLRRVFWICMAFPIAASLLLMAAKAFGASVSVSSNDVVLGLVIPGAFIYIFRVAPYFAAKSAYKVSANFHNPIHWLFTDEGITQEIATARSELLWSTFIRALETNELFLLYVQKRFAYPLPKRAFANPEEIQRFRELLRRHMQNVTLRSN